MKRSKRQEIIINSSIKRILNEYKEHYSYLIRNPINPLFFTPQTHQSIMRESKSGFKNHRLTELPQA
jgi:hypothetical protein